MSDSSTAPMPSGPTDSTQTPRFAGRSTFGRLPAVGEVGDFDLSVIGIPFDGGTSYRPGARFGPMAVRQASRHLRMAYNPDLDVDPFSGIQVVDAGDVPCTPFSIDEALAQTERFVSHHLSTERRAFCIGGDHTVTLALLRAARRIHGPLALIHFDAHLDTWDTYFGADRTHGTVLRRAFEEGLLIENHSLHIGTRGSIYSRHDLADDSAFGFGTIRARDLDHLGLAGVIDRMRDRVGSHPVYVSVDIDVLDPAFAPGTGTPEFAGLTSRELQHLVQALPGDSLVGGDVVEVSPAYDQSEVTALAAATVLYDLISVIAIASRRSVSEAASGAAQ